MNNHLISYCYGYIVSNLIMIATNWTGVLRVVDSFSIIMIFIVVATMITIKLWQKKIMQNEYFDNIQTSQGSYSTREVFNFRFLRIIKHLRIFVLSFNILNLFIYLRDANMNQWSIVPAAVLLFVFPIAVFILYGHPIVRTVAPFIILALLGGVSLFVNNKCFEK